MNDQTQEPQEQSTGAESSVVLRRAHIEQLEVILKQAARHVEEEKHWHEDAKESLQRAERYYHDTMTKVVKATQTLEALDLAIAAAELALQEAAKHDEANR